MDLLHNLESFGSGIQSFAVLLEFRVCLVFVLFWGLGFFCLVGLFCFVFYRKALRKVYTKASAVVEFNDSFLYTHQQPG